MTVQVFSPVEGTLHPLDYVQDPIFAQEKVGPGVAIYPASFDEQVVRSPVEGTLARVMSYGAVVVTRTGVPILVHLGINTITLDGAGYTPLCATADNVRAGDPLLRWTPQIAVDAGLDPIVPVIVLDSDDLRVSTVAEAESHVRHEDIILEVDLHPQD